MAYWIQYGGIRERAYDSLTKTRKSVIAYMELKHGMPQAKQYDWIAIYDSKNSESPVGIVEMKIKGSTISGFIWSHNGTISILNKDGTLRTRYNRNKGSKWLPFGL